MDFLVILDRWATEIEDGGVVQGTVEKMILLLHGVSANFGANFRAVEDF